MTTPLDVARSRLGMDQPACHRRPLRDDYWKAVKAVECRVNDLAALTTDERFDGQSTALAHRHLSDLTTTLQTLATVTATLRKDYQP